jgi:hypothetical protein
MVAVSYIKEIQYPEGEDGIVRNDEGEVVFRFLLITLLSDKEKEVILRFN